MKVTEYRISQAEIKRRKTAFCSLIIAIMVGLIISSIDFLISHILLYFILILVISGLLSGAIIWNIRWQNSFARKRFLVYDYAIKQIDTRSEETYCYKDIQRIAVKRTVKGYIRQIYLSLTYGRSTWINGLSPDDSEHLYRTLIGYCSNIAVKEIKESIDFDHRIFYPVLGLVISSIFTIFIRLVGGLSEANINIVQICIVSYIAIVGVIIILLRPYYNLHGAKGRKIDYAMGGVFFLIAGILSFFLFGR